MTNKIKINNSTSIDLQTLINTRLLVQANSGGGKSWLLRRLLEQSHGKVQQIVIDLEGEFSTLREKYDYILAGKGGDTPADPRSAALLARKILELNVSAIIDLYELHHQDRKHFVRLFLESMINAPKELWHPCLVVIDEAHIFCPEKGQSEAMEAVIDIATRGRKRGYCVVLATQRLSKLHKDAAAECNNKLIGRTGMDIDMKRAHEELGFTSKEQYYSLRNLEAGEFFAFGPAISREVIKTKVGDVQTTHPKAGSRILSAKPAPPTQKILSVLKKLGDLPQEAKKEASSIVDLKQKIREIGSHRCPKITSREDIDNAVSIALKNQEQQFSKQAQQWTVEINKCLQCFGDVFEKIKKSVEARNSTEEGIRMRTLPVKYSAKVSNGPRKKESELIISNMPLPRFDGEKPLNGGSLRMLKVLVSRYPMKMTKTQLATFSNLSPRSGTFGTYLSLLRSRDLIVEESKLFQASQVGIDEIGETPNPPQTSQEVIGMWREKLTGGARRMFDIMLEIYPQHISKEDLGNRAVVSPSGGSFSTYLSMLRSNGLIDVGREGVKVSDNLFL